MSANSGILRGIREGSETLPRAGFLAAAIAVVATAQLSVKWRLVPVLAAARNENSRAVLLPKPGIRATGSARMSRINAADDVVMKRRSAVAALSAASTSRIGRQTPPFAMPLPSVSRVV